MANVTNASTQDIYDRLAETQGHHPFEADTFASWATQAGDVVTMKSGEDEYDAPVYSTRMVWKGTPQTRLSSTGNKERDSVSKVGKKKYGRGGAGMRAQQGLYYDLYSEDGQLHSSLMMTESVLRTQFEAANSTLYSVIQQTATQVFTGVYDTVSGTFSTLEQTASMIRTSVSDSKSVMYSTIMQTASGIRTEVADLRSGLRSTIEQLPDKIELAVGKATSGIYGSVISMTSSYIMTAVRETASSIAESVIIQTESVIMSEVRSTTSAIAWSVITQTMTNIEQEIGRKAQIFVQPTDPATDGQHHVVEHDIWIQSIGITTWGQFGVEGSKWNDRSAYEWRKYYGGTMFVRKNGAWQQVTDSSDAVEMSTKIDQTDEYIALLAHQTDLKGEEYMASLRVTAKEVRSEVSAAKSTLYSTISQTATNILMQVADTERDLQTSIEQTAERVSISASAARSELFSVISVTATNVWSHVEDVGADLQTNIEQTASEIRISASAARSSLYSLITTTSTNIMNTVVNKEAGLRSAIEQTASKVSIVVDNNFNVKPAKIVAAINGNTSTSTVIISADRIDLDGVVHTTEFTSEKIRTMLADITGNLYVSGNIYAGLSGESYFQGTSLKLVGPSSSQGARTLTLSYSTMSTAIKEASVSSNTLTLTRFDGTTVNFSKAVSLENSWSNGKFTVNAKQNNTTVQSVFTSLTVGAFTWNGTTGTAPIKATIGTSPTIYDTGKTATLMDANLLPANIKSGVTIFGTQGDYLGGDVSDIGYSWLGGRLTVSLNGESRALTGVRVDGNWSGNRYDGELYYYDGSSSGGPYHEMGYSFELYAPGGGDSYTRYNFYKSLTQDSSGYHYTFSIGTGWNTPFGGDGGTYYLYKKN